MNDLNAIAAAKPSPACGRGWRGAAEPPQLFFAHSVMRLCGGKAMDAAVDLNNQLCLNDCKVGDEATDGVLTSDGDAEFAERAQRFPRDRFGRIRAAAKASCGLDVLIVAHDLIAAPRSLETSSRAPRPRPLSRKRERGEWLQ